MLEIKMGRYTNWATVWKTVQQNAGSNQLIEVAFIFYYFNLVLILRKLNFLFLFYFFCFVVVFIFYYFN
jgi:hypothetical protein